MPSLIQGADSATEAGLKTLVGDPHTVTKNKPNTQKEIYSEIYSQRLKVDNLK